MPETPYAVDVRAALQYGAVPGLPAWQAALYLDLLLPTPRPPSPAPAVIYLHGGGWRAGERSAGLYPWLGPLLAAHGFVVANVTYRLSDRATFPAQLHDVKAAVRWLRANAAAYGVDPDRVGAWGDSAGGHLAALLGTTANRADLEGDCGSPGWSSAVQAAIMRCAPSDFLPMPEDQAEVLDALFGGPRAETPELRRLASPAGYARAGVPPFLIVHGTNDETVPFAQAETMVRALRAYDGDVTFHVVEGGHHNLLPDVDAPWGNEPWTELGAQALAFFQRTLVSPRDSVHVI
ncbi:alpha/beta hydrolase [Actinopolymorpha alba]|uniref:alpha/beta hydrolase n=1 Tax=Actinopolymorpha alba TaxID=533267 RepID=UPI0012F688ED|nr:alpha/beta hydrolase [Actinopolymorpha alba]